MSSELFGRFVPVICAGIGLILVGGVSLLLARQQWWVRLPASLAVLGLVLAGVSGLSQPGLAAATACLLALGLVPCTLLAERRLTARLAAGVGALHRPAVRFGLLTCAGLGVCVVALVQFERADEAAVEAEMADLELMQGHPLTRQSGASRAATDRGTRVILREPIVTRDESDLRLVEDRLLHNTRLEEYVIRRGPAGDQSNCHGWVFAGGKYLLASETVDLILRENGYRETRQPRPGDLVIYRQSGEVAHSAVVLYMTEGQPVLVEGKWGNLGIFLHPAEKCTYGQVYSFYHSDRRGHRLAGLDDPAPEDAPALATEK